MSGLLSVEQADRLTAGLSTILARVRCAAVHGQANDGRCVSCISWANRIGAPHHAPRLKADVADLLDEARRDERRKVAEEVARD